MRFSKIIIAALLIFLAAFTVAMIVCAFAVQYEPSTLIGCVFGFAAAEGGILGMIKIFEKDGNNKNDRSDNNNSSCNNTFSGADHSICDSLDQEQDNQDSARAD